MTTTVGIDVGATTIAGGLVAADGTVLWATRRATHGAGEGTAWQATHGVIDAVLAEGRHRGLALEAIGMGLAGAVDVDAGTIVSDVTFIPELIGVPIAGDIGARTGLPAFVDNDVNALALGEWRFGLGRGTRSMVLLAVGTGVGGGIILERQLVRGAAGYAGEFGHVPIKFDGPDCVCGGRGCADIYFGGHQLADEARRQLAAGAASVLAARAREGVAITSKLVFAAAADGDPLAVTLVDRACEALAAAIGGIVNGLNPELIVVTGGVARSLVPLEKDVFRRVSRYAFARPLGRTRFAVVPGDKSLTVRGGAALALYELDRRSREAGWRGHDVR